VAENDEDADLLLYADLLDHDGHDDGADRVGEPSEPVVEEGASSRVIHEDEREDVPLAAKKRRVGGPKSGSKDMADPQSRPETPVADDAHLSALLARLSTIRAHFSEMGLDVRVENAIDDAAAEATLLGAILRSVELVPQPSMSLEVLRQLMARNHHAGHQVGMQRGTHQKTGEHGLDSFKAEAGELSQFLHALDNSVTAGGWQLHNQFANINRGGSEQPADDASMVSEEVGGFEGGKWHFDKFTEPATHRQANYYGNTGSLRLRYGGIAGSLRYEGVVVTIIAPLVRQLTLKPRGPREGQHQTQRIRALPAVRTALSVRARSWPTWPLHLFCQ